MQQKKRLNLIIKFTVAFALAGICIRYTIILFSLLSSNKNISHENIALLYSYTNAFYFLDLIPVFFIIAGFIAGTRIAGIRDRYNEKMSQYESIILRTVEFAGNIEKQDLTKQFIPVNGESILAGALESMRTSLISKSRKEFERNEANRITGKFSTLLQGYNDLQKLSNETVAYMVRNLDGIVQAAFYLVEDLDGNEKIIRMKSSYAYNRKKYLNAEFRFGQGLIGQAVLEKDIILRTEIPDNYMTITSGILGERKPKILVISPMMAEDSVYGVIELASLSSIPEYQFKILKDLCTISAHAIASFRNNQRTYELLKKSELMSSELIRQQNQLRQNAVDLLKTQEELKAANVKLEQQINEVHKAGKKIQVLLENSKEIISIISEEGKIKYVSPSIKGIAGYYPEELINLEETANVHPMDTEKFKKLTSDLKSFPEKEITINYRYFTRNGKVIWMEATGKNLVHDNVINGFVINSRDISEQRTAAKEQRIRAKMQALSENSSDIIIRIDIFNRCTYVNPVIKEYTGISKESYIGKPLSNSEMNETVIAGLKTLLNETAGTKLKKTSEIIFPTPEGNKIMQINAIPEFNENGESESVLFVCHDITEAKSREEIIRKKNKSISDSINYAYNIQSALMPTEETLRRLLPNSFMFYKPKDVVSGDYPWLVKQGDSIYVGAMDCTGHGVPGAMMSIIGFFLQDSIINKGEEINAGEVLNMLHESVVAKLKQAEPDSKINDGMDAAFCRINLVKRELDFAGAHRSLYHVSNNSVSEIKGDRWPVGSTQYRNRKEFTNHKIAYNHGDAFYFMTDGFTDQFGGPTGKEKFTSQRAGKLISENTHLSIFQVGNVFRNMFEEWKGSVSQTDDILIIGLKP
jgi:PAS domain S-box-containing protein